MTIKTEVIPGSLKSRSCQPAFFELASVGIDEPVNIHNEGMWHANNPGSSTLIGVPSIYSRHFHTNA
jgi:hypothetical protein